MLNLSLRNYSRVTFNINTLFYGDNLEILKHLIPDESIDLIYLDPPFNSKADYNILFKEVGGEKSTAQIQAFSDFWYWDIQARRAYEFLTGNDVDENVANLAVAIYHLFGKSDMSAYLFMMAVRLIELKRVLKSTGSIFLHCDTTASHYLKLLMDSIFDVRNFRNEIIWKRQTGHSDARIKFGKIPDRLLFYSKSSESKFYRQAKELNKEYVKSKFSDINEHGRRYTLTGLNPPGGRGPVYEFHGVTMPWKYTEEKMRQLEADGRIYTGWKIPRLIRYLDETEKKV